MTRVDTALLPTILLYLPVLEEDYHRLGIVSIVLSFIIMTRVDTALLLTILLYLNTFEHLFL